VTSAVALLLAVVMAVAAQSPAWAEQPDDPALTPPAPSDTVAPPPPPSTEPGSGSVAPRSRLSPLAGGVTIDRINGADRFDVAVQVSQRAYPDGAPVVVVANGFTFPDALSGAPAAAALGGPVLLATTDGVPVAVWNEIRRLQPQRIIMLGGLASLSTAAEIQLAQLAPEVVRIGGPDRYAVSRAIATRYFGSASTVFVATGRGFPDALAGAGAAARLGAPVLLIDGAAAALDPATAGLLGGLDLERIVILGGPATVSDRIALELQNYAPTIERIGGADRFAVAVAISERFVPTAHMALITTGLNFPDALTGAALAAAGAPLYLVPPACPPAAMLADAFDRLDVDSVVILGGERSVIRDVELLSDCEAVAGARLASETALAQAISAVDAAYPGTYSVSVRELEGMRRVVSVGGDRMQEPVSVIKLFVAYAVLDRIERGTLSFTSRTSSGTTVEECLAVMIHVSDNYCHWELTALVGNQTLNNQFWAEGYRGTVYAGYGGNGVYHPAKLSTTDDIALLLERLQRGELLRPDLTEHFFTLLETQLWRSKLPSGVQTGVPVANKTGSAWASVGWFHSDAGVVAAPNGPYAIAVLGSGGATVAGVREIGRVVYEHLNAPITDRASYSSLNAITTRDVDAYQDAAMTNRITTIAAGTFVEVDASVRTRYRIFFQGSALWVQASALRNAIDYPRSAR
jgi:putative cell wall-binding protein/beta-lactamase class A